MARWSRRIVVASVVAFGLYLIVAMWLFPLAIRHIVVPKTSDRLVGTLEVGTVRFHPFRLALRIDDLLLRDEAGTVAFSMQRFRGRFAMWRTLRSPGLHFDRVILDRPLVRVERDAEAVLNFARIFAREPSESADDKPGIRRIPHLVIDEVAVNDGTLAWRDDATPESFAVDLQGFNLLVEHLDTAPTNDNDFLVVAVSDSGASLRWDATFFADPFSSHGRVIISRIPIETLMPYAMRHTDATVTSGSLTIELVYDFAPARTPRAAVLDLKRIALDDFRADRDGRPLVDLPRVRLDGIVTDADARSLAVERLRLDDGALRVDRDEEGVLNLVRMLQFAGPVDAAQSADPAARSDAPSEGLPEEPTVIAVGESSVTRGELPLVPALPEPAELAGPTPATDRIEIDDIEYPLRQLVAAITYLLEDLLGPWTLSIESIEIENQSVDLVDHTTIEPVTAEVRGLSLRAGPVHTDQNYRIPFATSMRLGNSGAMRLDGEVGAGDGDLDIQIRVDDLRLGPIAPYVWGLAPEPLDEARLRDGIVDLDGRLAGSWSGAEDLRATWSGDLRAVDVSVSDADGASMATLVASTASGRLLLIHRMGVGTDVTLNGTFALEGVESARPFLSALGLGDDGAATLESLSLTGTFGAALPYGGEATMRADGRIDGRGFASTLPELPLRAASLGALSAEIELTGPLDRLADAQVSGMAVVEDLKLNALLGSDGDAAGPGDSIEAQLIAVRMELDGSTTLRIADGETIELLASGRIVGSSVAGTHDRQTIGFESSEMQGAATVVIAAESIRVRGDGAVGFAALTGADGDSISAAADAARLVGTVDAALGAPTTIDLDGTLELDGASEALVGTRRFGAATAIARGTLTFTDGTPNDLPESVREATDATVGNRGEDGPHWRVLARGELSGTAASVTLPGAAETPHTPSEGTMDAFRLEGDAIVELGTDGSIWLDTVGTVDVQAGVFRTELDATIGAAALALDGVTRLHGGAEGAMDLSLRGHGELRDLVGERLDPALEGITGGLIAVRGLASRGSDGGFDLEGDIAIDRASAALRDEHGPASVALDSLRAQGTIGASADDPLLRVAGAVELAEVEATRSSTDGTAAEIVATIDSLTADGSADVPYGGGEDGAMRIATTAVVHGLRLALPGPSDVLLAVAEITATGIEFDQAAGTIVGTSVNVARPTLTATVGLVPDSSTSSEPPRRASDLAASLPLRVRLGSLVLEEGSIELIDAEDPTGTTMLIDELSVTASEIATDGSALATIEASSRVQGSGRFRATGTADPFRPLPEADLVVTLTGVPLPPFSALAGAYAGWRIDQGRLTTNIPVRVTAGQVRGELGFTLDRVRLGERVRSPLAPSVPLDIGLSLLRDRNDQVTGRVPFTGNMADPRFSFSGIILQAFFGLIGQVVTAPFQLLASVFGGGEEDVSSIGFEAGLAEATDEGAERIGVIGRALEDRPALSLEIFGHYAIAPDGDALRPGLLQDEVLRRLRTSFPNLTEVGEGLYRQVVISIHVERLGPPAATFEETEAAVLATVEVPDDRLRDLARRRALAVLDALADEYGVDRSRLTATAPSAETIARERPEVHLELF